MLRDDVADFVWTTRVTSHVPFARFGPDHRNAVLEAIRLIDRVLRTERRRRSRGSRLRD